MLQRRRMRISSKTVIISVDAPTKDAAMFLPLLYGTVKPTRTALLGFGDPGTTSIPSPYLKELTSGFQALLSLCDSTAVLQRYWAIGFDMQYISCTHEHRSPIMHEVWFCFARHPQSGIITKGS